MKRQVIATLILGLLFAGLGCMSAPQPYERMLTSSVTIFSAKGPAGSGVVIDDNVIVTAAHVLRFTLDEIGPNFTIRLYDGTLVDSNDIYFDYEHDVGFIFVDMDEESVAELGDFGCVGDNIFIVGNPFGDLEFSLTNGIISHPSRQFMIHPDLFQVTAPIACGSSGGPMYNEHGKLLGIVTGFRYLSGFTAVTKVKYIKQVYKEWKDKHGSDS